MSLQTAVSDHTIDLSGLRCPNLVIATIKTLAALENGRILKVITTDLNSPSNMALWCRQSGHSLLDMYEENGRFIFFIKKQGKV
ncbi:MAG: sulfurtransferase TusA family protein [Anaerolineales bacterium]|nr:sulfurtransferase TusA family protein [Anaerolineales bacterium]MCA9932027.1 sulfurtransferase TusA family protein [Anaerolineales bacterium]